MKPYWFRIDNEGRTPGQQGGSQILVIDAERAIAACKEERADFSMFHAVCENLGIEVATCTDNYLRMKNAPR
jgi:hypothetical protein